MVVRYIVWCPRKSRFRAGGDKNIRTYRIFYIHSGYTGPTQATARLFIGLVSRIQKSSTGDNNFVKWKRTFRSERPKLADRSKWATFKGSPKYSGRTEPKPSVPSDFQRKIPEESAQNTEDYRFEAEEFFCLRMRKRLWNNAFLLLLRRKYSNTKT